MWRYLLALALARSLGSAADMSGFLQPFSDVTSCFVLVFFNQRAHKSSMILKSSLDIQNLTPF